MTEIISGARLRMKHIRQAGLCADGVKAWAAQHGFSLRTLTHEGYPVEVIEATGDKFALDVCKIARDEHVG